MSLMLKPQKQAFSWSLADLWDPYLCSQCLWSKRQWDPQRRRLVTRPGRYRKGDFSIQLLWLGRGGQIKDKPSPDMKWSLTKLQLLVAWSVPAPVCEQEAVLCAYYKGPKGISLEMRTSCQNSIIKSFQTMGAREKKFMNVNKYLKKKNKTCSIREDLWMVIFRTIHLQIG